MPLGELRRAESNHLPPGYEPGELPVLYSAPPNVPFLGPIVNTSFPEFIESGAVERRIFPACTGIFDFL
jgi:hypothetical protein